jgi:hypothetical protein
LSKKFERLVPSLPPHSERGGLVLVVDGYPHEIAIKAETSRTPHQPTQSEQKEIDGATPGVCRDGTSSPPAAWSSSRGTRDTR